MIRKKRIRGKQADVYANEWHITNNQQKTSYHKDNNKEKMKMNDFYYQFNDDDLMAINDEINNLKKAGWTCGCKDGDCGCLLSKAIWDALHDGMYSLMDELQGAIKTFYNEMKENEADD